MVWFSNETFENIELFIILKIENWPIKSPGGIRGVTKTPSLSEKHTQQSVLWHHNEAIVDDVADVATGVTSGL